MQGKLEYTVSMHAFCVDVFYHADCKCQTRMTDGFTDGVEERVTSNLDGGISVM